ncbi:hypothetical protein EKO04_004174 [Ascochyta lentis]|uniref:Uncharacterized protein n=1 Tax=Ascochyta lentis TaxID=205686 RepID=A0A8H7J7N4_9PLEO|nr:hypothetical protein EKO04_004174 [Ascochyta lentis]
MNWGVAPPPPRLKYWGVTPPRLDELGSRAATTTTTTTIDVLGSRDTTTTTEVLGSRAATIDILGNAATTKVLGSLQSQYDACQSTNESKFDHEGEQSSGLGVQEKAFLEKSKTPTQSEFDREWEAAYLKWLKEQEFRESGNMGVDEPKTGVSAQSVEMNLCEPDVKSNCSQDDGAGMSHKTLSNAAINTVLWPAGFSSLRFVASATLVARLLHLPSLETLYLNGLRCEPDDGSGEYDNDDDSDAGSDWEENEWMIHDSPSHSADFISWLCEAPRKLRTVAFRNSGPNADDFHRASHIVRELNNAQGSSLESLIWYGFDSNSVRSDECSVVELDENELDSFRELKQLSFSVHDLATGAYRSTWGDAPDGYESHDDYYVQYVAEALPKSLESLVLWEDAGSGQYGDKEGETVLLERAIIKMIESGHYENLRAIHLEQVERATDHGEGTVNFNQAVAVGKAVGVDIFTLANRPIEQSKSFTEPVEQYDLKTGKYPGGRPNDWVFDYYTGCRKPLSR